MRFNLHKKDFELISAANRFGEWIIRQPEATATDRAVVKELQKALLRLPEPTFVKNLSFGIGLLEDKSYDKFISRGWEVSLYNYGKLKLELSIFSDWTPYPPVDCFEMAEKELSFNLLLGEVAAPSDYNAQRWIDEVEDMDRIRADGRDLIISCTYVEGSRL